MSTAAKSPKQTTYYGDDYKSYINISNHAFECLENNIEVFSVGVKQFSKAEIINRIFCSYYKFAKASLAENIEIKLHGLNKTDKEKYLQFKKMELMQEVKKTLLSEKGNKIRFRPRDETIEILESFFINQESDNYKLYNGSFNKYIKAVIEEYAGLAFVDQERIFYIKNIDIIEDAIKRGKNLTITLVGKVKEKEKKCYEVIPYKIMCDKITMYNYLVCMARKSGTSNYQIMSFRISRIDNVSININNFDKLDNINEIEERCQKCGVQFVVGTPETIKVKLTKKGIIDYNNIISQRPPYTEIDKNIYTFECSEKQIEVYFLKFCANAEVLEPNSLNKRFCSLYKKAYNLYNQDNK